MNFRIAAVLLATLASSPAWVVAEEPKPEEPKKPGFWRRLANEGLRIEVGKDGVRTGPAQQAGASTGGGASNAGLIYQGDSIEPLHTPISGANVLPGLFANDDYTAASKGRLEWPRVAVTWKEFGEQMPCWLGEARVWSSATSSKTESFRLCTSAIEVKDDLGQSGFLKWQSISALGTRLRNTELNFTENTGAKRTQGPLPPLKPFGVNIAVKMQPGGLHTADNFLRVRYEAIIVRLAWVSGFLRPEDITDTVGMELNRSADKRLWVAGFDAAGNKDAQP